MRVYNVGAFSSKTKKKRDHRQLRRVPQIEHTAAAATCRCQQVASITSFLRTREFVTALATAVVVAAIIAFVSALAVQWRGRGVATCQEETTLKLTSL